MEEVPVKWCIKRSSEVAVRKRMDSRTDIKEGQDEMKEECELGREKTEHFGGAERSQLTER